MSAAPLRIGIFDGDDIGLEIVPAALADPAGRTGDIRGKGRTEGFARAVLAHLG